MAYWEPSFPCLERRRTLHWLAIEVPWCTVMYPTFLVATVPLLLNKNHRTPPADSFSLLPRCSKLQSFRFEPSSHDLTSTSTVIVIHSCFILNLSVPWALLTTEKMKNYFPGHDWRQIYIYIPGISLVRISQGMQGIRCLPAHSFVRKRSLKKCTCVQVCVCVTQHCPVLQELRSHRAGKYFAPILAC